MSKFYYCIFAVVLSFFSVNSYADVKEFKEGEYYSSIEGNQLSETKQITEFFSFYCGHCYNFRSVWDDLKIKYPNVSFNRIPVHFLGGPNGPLTQRAYATAEIMGIEDDFTNTLFNQIHSFNKTEYNQDSLGDVAGYVGADKKQFLEVFDSFMPISKVASYNSEVDKARIKGVPTIMINHKYLILKAEKHELHDLITYLLTKDNVPDKKQLQTDHLIQTLQLKVPVAFFYA